MYTPQFAKPRFTFSSIWRTLRFRLAVWNAAVVVVTALVTLIGLRQGVRWALVHELDQMLIDDAREIGLDLESSADSQLAELHDELTRMADGHENRGWYVKLLGARQQIKWASPNARPDMPRILLTDELAPISFDGYRIVYHKIDHGPNGIEAFRVGATLEYIDQDMARIDRWVLLAATAVLLAAPLCGYFLAARAARTVGEIITSASQLRPSHLEDRLPIRGSGDELDQLAQTINSLLDRIAAYLNTKRDFLANAAHELRTPLAAIRSSVEVALNGERSAEEYEELMVDVIDECSALETLVNQLLLLSETEADLPSSRFEPLDVSELAAKSVDMFTGVADARGIRLTARSLHEALVYGNHGLLRQVLNNLLDNAVKYTHAGGQIIVDVTVDQPAREVHVQVHDTGQGISPDEQRHIFERFFRAESARSRLPGVGGTGLGLSICQSIVHSHGGDITCHSQPDRGTTFTVILPMAEARRSQIESAERLQTT